MIVKTIRGVVAFLLLATVAFGIGDNSPLAAAEKTENFDKPPNWHGFNNRSNVFEPRTITQNFGYSATQHAGGNGPGEFGGTITPAAEPAYYARKIRPKNFEETLTASGTFKSVAGHGNVLIGFFNADTINEWRTPNTVALRIYGRGDVFYAYVEYMSQKWRAGADSPQPFPMVKDPESGRETFKGFASNLKHRWSLKYDPKANNGDGAVIATIDDVTAVCHLDKGHKADGAIFNRFGLLNVVKSADTSGEIWIDDVEVNGETEAFDNDPKWQEFQNRREYISDGVRPRFDFGYSNTNHAVGNNRGELGGTVFRGDNRTPDKMAAFGDRLKRLSLDKPLVASGKVVLRRAVSDSTALIGFYNSRESLKSSDSQRSGLPNSFLGVAIEGPSRDGFFFYPAGNVGSGPLAGNYGDSPQILPDESSHDWSFKYEPTADGGGVATVSLDGKGSTLRISADDRKLGATFDRFGIVTTWIDGNQQLIYFDDLTYTWNQE
ncbi:MAG: hypothetical protein AB7O26_11290 [Planctomycetaceae bacterium]